MGRRRTAPGLRAGLRNAEKLGRQMNREAAADYAVALSANTAGVANLRAQVGRLSRDMNAVVGFQNANLRSLARESRATARMTANREGAAVNAYGGGFSGAAATAFQGAEVAARGGVQVSNAAVAQGKGANRVAETVGALAAQGVSAQQAAAEYQLAEALQQRNIVSAETVAQLQGDLYKMAIQYNMEWKMWKKQQDYAKKLADEEDKGGLRQLKADVGRLVDEGGQISVGAAEVWREFRDRKRAGELEEGEELNITAEAQTWAQRMGFDPAGPEAQVFMAVLRQISMGMNTPEAYESALNSLYSGLPGWERWGQATVSAGMSRIRLELLASLTQYNEGLDPNDDDGENTAAGGAAINYPPGLSGAEKRIYALQHGFTPVPSYHSG